MSIFRNVIRDIVRSHINDIFGSANNLYVFGYIDSSSNTLPLGSDLTLTWIPTGVSIDMTYTYQWIKDGEAISGETNDTLVVNNITGDDAGNYFVLVTNVEDGRYRLFGPEIITIGGYSPISLSVLRQYLDSSYASASIDGLQVIDSLETHGTVRAPEPGACWNFDGVNDYGTLGARITTGGQTALTVTATIIPSSISGNLAICSEWNSGSIFLLQQFNAQLSFVAYYTETPLTSTSTTDTNVLAVGVPAKIAVTFNAGTIVFYVNGVVVANTQVGGPAPALRSVSSHFIIGALGPGTWNYPGKICDVRVYSSVKSLAEIQAIAACDGSAIDITNALAIYHCNERAGTTGYDSSGNGNNLTLSGPITEATFHATDSGITSNPFNVVGGSIVGGVRIPRDESDITKDVQGNVLEYSGKTPYPAVFNTPCITFAATNYAESDSAVAINLGNDWTIALWVRVESTNAIDFISIGDASTTGVGLSSLSGSLCWYAAGSSGVVGNSSFAIDTWTHLAISKTGTTLSYYVNGVFAQSKTASPSGSSHIVRLGNLYYSGNYIRETKRISSARLYSAAKSAPELLVIVAGTDDRTSLLGSWKIQEGPGSSNTNRTLYDDSGNGHHLTVIGGTVATQWANSVPGYVRDHAFEYGGRLGAAGQFIPLVPGTSLCADGNAPTILPGTLRGNPFSTVNYNPWSAAEANGEAWQEKYDSLPCVTCNYSNNYVSLGSIGTHSDFTFEILYYQLDNTYGRLADCRNNSGSYLWSIVQNYNATSQVDLQINGGFYAPCAGALTIGDWHRIRLNRTVNLWTMTVTNLRTNAVVSNSVSSSQVFDAASPFYLGGGYNNAGTPAISLPSAASFCNATLLQNGGTKLFPLTDGSGDDIAMYENGVATIISNAIQGTLTNVWANNTDGLVDHTYPEAMRAVVPRDQQFNDGEAIHFATKDPLTGADLTNALNFLS